MPRSSVTTELVTVLFTDIVSSTEIASEVGDRRWRALVAAHHDVVRQALRRHRGRELDTAGDGFFASFARPADAIRCACEIAEGVRRFGLEIRAGLNLGEAEIMGGKVGGLVVNTGARIMAIGGAGEVLVSATVRDAVAGKGIGFADRGVHRLKGIEGDHRVSVVATLDDHPVEGPLHPSEARRRRELPPPAPARTRRWRTAGIAAAVIVLGSVGFVLSWGDGGATPPRRDPVSAASEMTEADEQLARLVPTAFADSCIATGTRPASANASVSCTDGDVTVRYDGYTSPEDVRRAFVLATAGRSFDGTSCRDASSATGHYDVRGLARGSVACWVDREVLSFRPTIVWSDETLLVTAQAWMDVGTEVRGSVPDLSLYAWWSERAGPTDIGSAVPKDDPLDVPLGTWSITITEGDVGPANEGGVDAAFVGETTLTLDGASATISQGGDDLAYDLLWGKPNRLVLRQVGPLGDDFTGQCPRYESWTWRLRGDTLVLSDPSDEPNCNALRNVLTYEPLLRVA